VGFGIWNVKSLSISSLFITVASEMVKCNLDLVPVEDVRWDNVVNK
jgi:hypothetical protein